MSDMNGQHAQQMAEQQQRQQEGQIAQQGHHFAMQRAKEIQNDLLDEISTSDLQEGSRKLLKNLVSKDFIFANLTEEEVIEFKYKLLLKRESFYSMHPSSESIIEGELRAYVNDNPADTLTSLTQQQKLIVDQFFEGVWMRVTRARGMKQQEILQTQITQSVTDGLGGDSGGGGGLLGRWRS